MPSINSQILDDTLESKVDLLRFAESERERIAVLLEQLVSDLRSEIIDADLAGIARTSSRIRATQDLLNNATDTIDTAYRDASKSLDAQIVPLASLQQTAALTLLNKPLQATLAKPVLHAEELRALTRLPVVLGAPARDYWDQQSKQLQFRFASQIRLGSLLGETNDQIVQRIIGKSSGRRRVVTIDGKRTVLTERVGGLMAISNRSAMALVRTALLSISNHVHQEVYNANSDILQGYQLVVTLDARTSHVCMARAGGAWDFEGNPLPSSPVKIKYPGPPPYHFNCRSVIIPLLKSWADISGIRGAKNIPDGTRASMDGQVPVGDLTYEQWLKTKSEDFQREKLGPGRYKLWKAGKITLSQLVDQTGNSLTLEELKRRI